VNADIIAGSKKKNNNNKKTRNEVTKGIGDNDEAEESNS
jgi:hypothetical protein